MKIHPEELHQAARSLYIKRYTPKEIAETLGIALRTIHHWSRVEEWDSLLNHETAEQSIKRRLSLLVERDPKTPQELKELETLMNSLERFQAMRLKERQRASHGDAGNADEAEKPARSKRKKKDKKNDVSMLTASMFEEKFHTRFFAYQHAWRALLNQRNRMLLKSRQVGATWYFAQEAFEDACLNGGNQIFLSATRAQAEVFRNYIVRLAGEAFDIELKGNPLFLHTHKGIAELHFLSNNSKSAQSYSGNVYIDEFFWITKFDELKKVASAMATQKRWRRTLFSTPSAVTHEAYPFWTGETFQKRFTKPKPWPNANAIHTGVACPDGQFRQMVTIHDAIKGGCNLIDIDQLKLEYSPEEFRQLFCCEFIDDTQSVFKLSTLQRCMVDPADWKDVTLGTSSPVGRRPVWGGYDPARSRDDATFVVLLPPEKEGGTIRVIERHKWQGQSYLWQAGRIKELCDRYHFSHLGIDTTGPGIGVFEHVQQFCPQAMPINYAVHSKAMLVLKAREVMEEARLQFDAAETDIAHAFMTIRQTTTDKGQITYTASRNSSTGHADAAWAIMHALAAEPLARQGGSSCLIAIG